MPTMNAHYEGSPDFVSAAHDAGLIVQYLQESRIEEISVLLGVSLGAVVALELSGQLTQANFNYLDQKFIALNRVVIDGAPLFDSFVMRAGFVGEARRLRDLSRTHPEKALKMAAGIYNGFSDELVSHAQTISNESIEGFASSVCRAKLPLLNKDMQKLITFT